MYQVQQDAVGGTLIQGWKVMMDRGPYKGRPGIITSVQGDKCTVVLTDTRNYPKEADVTINNVTVNDFHRM